MVFEVKEVEVIVVEVVVAIFREVVGGEKRYGNSGSGGSDGSGDFGERGVMVVMVVVAVSVENL